MLSADYALALLKRMDFTAVGDNSSVMWMLYLLTLLMLPQRLLLII